MSNEYAGYGGPGAFRQLKSDLMRTVAIDRDNQGHWLREWAVAEWRVAQVSRDARAMFAECKRLCLAPMEEVKLTDEEKALLAFLVAQQKVRDDAKRSYSPQVPLPLQAPSCKH